METKPSIDDYNDQIINKVVVENLDGKMRHSQEGFNVKDKVDRQRTKSIIEMEKAIAEEEERNQKPVPVETKSKRRQTEMP